MKLQWFDCQYDLSVNSTYVAPLEFWKRFMNFDKKHLKTYNKSPLHEKYSKIYAVNLRDIFIL